MSVAMPLSMPSKPRCLETNSMLIARLIHSVDVGDGGDEGAGDDGNVGSCYPG